MRGRSVGLGVGDCGRGRKRWIEGAYVRGSKGFLVLGVDYFQGDSCDNYRDQVGWDKVAWVSGMRKSAAPLVPPWLAAVRELYGKPCTFVPQVRMGNLTCVVCCQRNLGRGSSRSVGGFVRPRTAFA